MKVESVSSNISSETTMHKEQLEFTDEPGKKSILKNLTIISLAFFFLFLAFDSLTNLQSTMNVEYHVGMLSQTIIYVANILSCLFLPKLIIKKIGCKYASFLSILAFIPFFVANFYLHIGMFFSSAAILGIGSGILWSVEGTYINQLGELYAAHSKATVEVITSRFFGIFYFVYCCTQIWGNLVSFYIIKPNDSASSGNFTTNNITEVLTKYDNVTCGANFCGGMNENMLPPTEFKRYTLSGVYLCFALTSALIVLFFMDSFKENAIMSNQDDSSFSSVAATLNHLRNTDQLLIVPLSIFCGLQESFIFADYSQAFVACAWGLHNVSLVFVCFGVVGAIMSFFSGRLVQYVPRSALMFTGAIANFGVCIVLLLWQPKSEEYVYFFVLVGIWGLSNGIWLTQVSALCGVLFKEEQEAAFANLRLWESVGYGLGFGNSSFLCMYQKIYILLAFLIVGFTGYIAIEIRKCASEETYKVKINKRLEDIVSFASLLVYYKAGRVDIKSRPHNSGEDGHSSSSNTEGPLCQ